MLTDFHTNELAALSDQDRLSIILFWAHKGGVLQLGVALPDIERPPAAVFMVIEDGAYVNCHPLRVAAAAFKYPGVSSARRGRVKLSVLD